MTHLQNVQAENALYIGGEWQAGVSTVANINPSDISETSVTLHKQVLSKFNKRFQRRNTLNQRVGKNAWLNASKRCFKRLVMSWLPVVMSWALCYLVKRVKPFAEGRGWDLPCRPFFQYFAAEVLRQIQDNADSVRPGVSVEVIREAGRRYRHYLLELPDSNSSLEKLLQHWLSVNSVIWKPANLTHQQVRLRLLRSSIAKVSLSYV